MLVSCRDDWDNHQDQHLSLSSCDGAFPQNAVEESYSRQPEPVPCRKTNGQFSSTESQVTIYNLLDLFFPTEIFYLFLIGILTMSASIKTSSSIAYKPEIWGEKSINKKIKIKREKCIQYR